MLARQPRHPSILLMFVVLWEIGLLLERREAVALISDDQYARNTLQGVAPQLTVVE